MKLPKNPLPNFFLEPIAEARKESGRGYSTRILEYFPYYSRYHVELLVRPSLSYTIHPLAGTHWLGKAILINFYACYQITSSLSPPIDLPNFLQPIMLRRGGILVMNPLPTECLYLNWHSWHQL